MEEQNVKIINKHGTCFIVITLHIVVVRDIIVCGGGAVEEARGGGGRSYENARDRMNETDSKTKKNKK